MRLRVEDNPKLIVRQDYQPTIVTGATPTFLIGSGATEVNNVSGVTWVVYSPTGQTAQWGEITGTLTDQTDLQNALDAKLDTTAFISYTGDTNTTISSIQDDITILDGQVVYLSGQTDLKLNTADFNAYSGDTTVLINSKAAQSDLNTHTGNTDIHFEMNQITGFTSTNDFNTYVNTTAPNTYLGINALDTYWTSAQTTSYINNQGFITSLAGYWTSGQTVDYVTGYTPTLDGYWNSGETVSYINSQNYLTGVTWNDITSKPDLALQADLNTHTGNTAIHFEMSEITGFTSTNSFNTYTGTTAPSQFLSSSALDNYWDSGETQSYISSLNYVTASIIDNIWTSAQTSTYIGNQNFLTGVTWNDITSKPELWTSGQTVSWVEAQGYSTGGTSTIAWGDITGTLSGQTDLQSALDLKANTVALSDYVPFSATAITTTFDFNYADYYYLMYLRTIVTDSWRNAGDDAYFKIGNNSIKMTLVSGSSFIQGGNFNLARDNAYFSLNKDGSTWTAVDLTEGVVEIQNGVLNYDSDQAGNFVDLSMINKGYADTRYMSITGGSGGGTWGSITGSLSAQTDLYLELQQKVDISSYNNDMQVLGDVIDNNYNEFTGYTATTAPNTYAGLTDFNTYTGTTAPATYMPINGSIDFSQVTGATSGNTNLQTALDLKLDIAAYNDDMQVITDEVDANYNYFTGHTGNTAIHFEMSAITGFTSTDTFSTYTGATETEIGNKLDTSVYSTYTGATATEIATKADLDATILSKSATYSVVAGDKGKIIEASGTFTITLPDGMDTGFRCDIVNVGTGTITLAASTTLQSDGTKLETQYTGASVYHRGSNVWIAVGKLTT